jgi:hypothetical protein
VRFFDDGRLVLTNNGADDAELLRSSGRLQNYVFAMKKGMGAVCVHRVKLRSAPASDRVELADNARNCQHFVHSWMGTSYALPLKLRSM